MQRFIVNLSFLFLLGCGAESNQSETLKSYAFPKETKYHRGDLARWGSSLRDNKFVLTFDDGPDPENTPKLLDILSEYNAQATFFVNTNLLEETHPNFLVHREIVMRMFREGHFVASHDHTHLNNMKEDQITHRNHLTKSIKILEALERISGFEQKEMYFRYPFGAYGYSEKYEYHHLNVLRDVSYDVYNENCINYVFWDFNTDDWVEELTAVDVYTNIISGIYGGWQKIHHRESKKDPWTYKLHYNKRPRNGGIILLHDTHSKNIEVLRMFLDHINESSFDIVPLSQVSEFNYDEKICVPSD